MLKLILTAFLALALVGGLYLFMMGPSTELIDASGAELTAGLPSAAVNAAEAEPAPDADGSPEAEGDVDPGARPQPTFTGPDLFQGEDFREILRLMDTGNHRPAKEQLVALMESSERDGEACILLSECCRELGEYDQAVDYGLKSVELLPDIGRAHHRYAKALGEKMMRGENKLAAMMLLPRWKDALARAIELDPGNTDARLEQLTFFTYMPSMIGGDVDRAIELAGELEVYDPARGKLWMALAYQQKGELPRAIELCDEGMSAYPADGMFACTLGGIHASQGEYEKADAAFEKARSLGRDEAYYRALISQANMHVDNGLDREKAIGLMDDYLAYHPDIPMMPPNAMVQFKKGQALEQLGRPEEARAAYLASLREQADYPDAQEALDALGPAGG